jgi:hypothetical protein
MGVEIRLRGTALPCIAQEDIRAGLAVKLVAAVNAPRSYGGAVYPDPNLQGSTYELKVGAALPSGENDTEAKFVAAFRVYNETPPIFETWPTTADGAGNGVPYTLRGFVEGSENMPATGITVRMVAPRLKEDAIIPSGAFMLAYDAGIYTVTSGCFTAASYDPGDPISVHANGIWYESNTGQVGVVWEQNTVKNTLTIKTGK